MSMLAERKQKQRWSLNPRGKHWSEDVNKFGHKMLEKMGWSAGKGLGAKEDGITEHVKVSYKNDAKGMGFKDNGEQWTQHEDKFTSLLSNLGDGFDANLLTLPTAEKSLELKSQSSKARVHYKKFTRGKDLSQRSEKDIANIFGRKTLERPVVQPQESNEEVAENGTEDKSFGVVTVKAGNMTDYFKEKLGKFGNLTSSKGDYALNGRDDYEPEIGACTGFGFASVKENQDENKTPSLAKNKINFVSPSKTEDETNYKKRKRDSEECTEVEPKKKKKNKKKEMAFDNLGSNINTAEEVCYDNPCLKQTDSPQISENNDGKEKKKRVTFSSPITEVLNKSDDSNKAEKSKKKKKNKPSTNGIDNLGCEDISIEESNRSEEKEKKSKKKKKLSIDIDENSVNGTKTKKKKKHEEVGIDNLACEEISVNEKNEEIKRYKIKKKAMEHGLVNPACEENSPTQKLKKKKRTSGENGLDNLGCEEISISEETEVPKKKKKQKNDSFEISVENISEMSQNDDEPKKKKKKKKDKAAEEDETTESPPKKLKKKSKSKESGIENLGCDEISFSEETQVPKKKKKQKNDSFEISVENISEMSQSDDETKTKKKKKEDKAAEEADTTESPPKKLKKKSKSKESGIENLGCEINTVEENIASINSEIDNYQTELENEINMKKAQKQETPEESSKNVSQNNYSPYQNNRKDNRMPKKIVFRNKFRKNGSRRRTITLYKGFPPPEKPINIPIKRLVKPGELKLGFVGTNITSLIGYGTALDLIKYNRPSLEPIAEKTN